MANDNIERLHYYQQQYLGAQDFEDEQAYHRDMRRRHNLAHHTWGIVTGLELEFHENDGTAWITPGMAIDGYGREIVVLLPKQLNPADFAAFQDVYKRSVWIEYQQQLTSSPKAGYGQCDPATNQYGRIDETCKVVVEPEAPYYGAIIVAGSALPSPPSAPKDDPTPILSRSVPYQEFPDDSTTTEHWLIPLGSINWDGVNQKFAKTDLAVTKTGRLYVGNISSEILVPARNLIVRDRNTKVPLPSADTEKPDGVVVTIEGTLEVDRTLQVDSLLTAKSDIQIHGGALDFRDINGSPDGTATNKDKLFTISHIEANTAGGIDLRVMIGKASAGKNRFVVGSDANDLFISDDKGDAHLEGTLDLKSNLAITTGIIDFGNTTRQMINLWTSGDETQQYGIGVQPNITYFRSFSDFRWYKGGKHADDPSKPDNGTLQMKLDQSGNLLVTGTIDLTNGLTVGGPVTLNNSLTVAGVTKLNDSLTVAKATTLNDQLTVTKATDLKGDLTVAGVTKLNKTLTVAKATSLNDKLTVTGATSLNDALTVAKATTLNDKLAVAGATTLNDALTVAKATSLNDKLTVTGATTLNDALIVAKATTLSDALTVERMTNLNGGLTLPGAIAVQGNNGLDVHASHLSFTSTANAGFEVRLGYVSVPGAPTHHDSDSIYGTPNLWLDAAGTVFIKQGFQMPAMDGAEHFLKGEPVEAGDVVVLSPQGERSIKLTEKENDASVIGVVSTDPAFILGGPCSANEIDAMGQTNVPVALMGTVRCKVDADRSGGIHKGDLLTTSPTKGHAQKVKNPAKAVGTVLGKAMEDLEQGQGLITILVMLA